ncbi:MAG TPA: hypothetical protein DCY13_14590 [Verrucomicrobiales bacterium]|nr:hypothetical protein [Verrucomicrobiales bacterium]
MKTRIMVVEDEAIVAEDIKVNLNELGYEVAAVCHTAEECLKQFPANAPDLVLMDIQLNGRMDGFAAADQVLNDHRCPVIYLTAFANTELIGKAKETEALDYVLKPFKKEQLKASIELALHKHALRREREQMTADLESALEERRTRGPFVPICAVCKKIRNSSGHWLPVEEFLSRGDFGRCQRCHCPECARNLFNEIRSRLRGPGT